MHPQPLWCYFMLCCLERDVSGPSLLFSFLSNTGTEAGAGTAAARSVCVVCVCVCVCHVISSEGLAVFLACVILVAVIAGP